MQAALRSSAAALRSTLLLQQLRASAATTSSEYRPSFRLLSPLYGNGNGNSCGFATQGTYLDKSVVTDRVLSVVKKLEKVDPTKVNPKAHFQNDLGLDSLDSVELVMAFEEEFQIEVPDTEADKIYSCADAIDYISSQPRAK